MMPLTLVFLEIDHAQMAVLARTRVHLEVDSQLGSEGCGDVAGGRGDRQENSLLVSARAPTYPSRTGIETRHPPDVNDSNTVLSCLSAQSAVVLFCPLSQGDAVNSLSKENQ